VEDEVSVDMINHREAMKDVRPTRCAFLALVMGLCFAFVVPVACKRGAGQGTGGGGGSDGTTSSGGSGGAMDGGVNDSGATDLAITGGGGMGGAPSDGAVTDASETEVPFPCGPCSPHWVCGGIPDAGYTDIDLTPEADGCYLSGLPGHKLLQPDGTITEDGVAIARAQKLGPQVGVYYPDGGQWFYCGGNLPCP
jgi:hypothetical protein